MMPPPTATLTVDGDSAGLAPLWTPSAPLKSQMYRFYALLRQKHPSSVPNCDICTPKGYSAFHRWSCDNLSTFWSEFATFAGIRMSSFSHVATIYISWLGRRGRADQSVSSMVLRCSSELCRALSWRSL